MSWAPRCGRNPSYLSEKICSKIGVNTWATACFCGNLSYSSCRKRVSQASPGKNINFRTMSPLALLRVTSSSIGLQLVVQPYPVTFSLIATSLFIGAVLFLQILLHNEHPCHQLMVPTRPIADFHRLANIHARRTQIIITRQTGGLHIGYKPIIKAGVSALAFAFSSQNALTLCHRFERCLYYLTYP